MKKLKILCCSILALIAGSAIGQTDSTQVKTSTTTTITTETGAPTTPAPAPAPAPEQPAEQQDNSGSDYSKFYIGARFMPTFTKLAVQTIDNNTAETSFVVGYGVGGFAGVNFSKNVGTQLEVIYSTLSQKYTDGGLERTIDLSYLHFPLLLVLNTDVSKPVNFNVAVGPQMGINTGSSIETEGGNGVDTVQAVIAVKPADFGLAYGAGFDFMLNPTLTLDIGFRGVYGIIDISDNNQTTTTDQYYILDRSKVKTYAAYAGLKLLF